MCQIEAGLTTGPLRQKKIDASKKPGNDGRVFYW